MNSIADPTPGLLGASDPVPVDVVNPNGESAILLTCEHAGREIPESLGDLGVAQTIFDQHIACDIGAEQLARHISKELDATLVLQAYSRLVIDCNRPFDASDCIPVKSDGSLIPANLDLGCIAKQQRFDEIHRPFHDTVKSLLDQRADSQRTTALVSVHSFTPKLLLSDFERPWQVGLLHGCNNVYAQEIQIDLQRIAPHLNVAFNEPYSIDSASDYTIPVHAEERGLPHVLLEVRNDELQTQAQSQHWGTLLARVLKTSFDRIVS